MLTLHVNDIDYKVEFTFEAAESDVVNTAFDFFSGASMLKTLPINDDETPTAEQIKEIQHKQLDEMLREASITPRLAIDFLYMGLLEHHGVYGDITQDIRTRADARAIYKQFAKENPEEEISMNVGLFEALKKQMEEDGFFKRIGLDNLMDGLNSTVTEAVENVQAEAPKKAGKKNTSTKA